MRTLPPTLLISDDDTSLLAALTRMAGSFGLAVIRDDTSKARTLARLHPDVILLDLKQLVDGREILVELKSNPETSNIPVIIMSGDADDFSRTECLLLGAAEFVAKPFDAMFMAKIARLAEEYRANALAAPPPPERF